MGSRVENGKIDQLDPADSPGASAGLQELSGIIGQSRKMRAVIDITRKVARCGSTVMIYGESGTGKELLARTIHRLSHRRNNELVAINCGAIPGNLLESELFGHVRGAFTGAVCQKAGKFERAHGGTVFLDEIGDMSAELQVKILRVLEERQFDRVGGDRTIDVDVRVIAATHQDLEKAVAAGTFREDLYYRLDVIPIVLPPVRERRCDIPLLVNHFLAKFQSDSSDEPKTISGQAMDMLAGYDWPGNVREIRNVVERVCVLSEDRVIRCSDLPGKIRGTGTRVRVPLMDISKDGISLNTAVSEFEKTLITQSLEKCNGVKNKAAKLLQLNRTTLVEKIKRYQLNEPA